MELGLDRREVEGLWDCSSSPKTLLKQAFVHQFLRWQNVVIFLIFNRRCFVITVGTTISFLSFVDEVDLPERSSS